MKFRRTLTVGLVAGLLLAAPVAFADEDADSDARISWAVLAPVEIDGADSGFFVYDDMNLDDALHAKLAEYEAAESVSLEDLFRVLSYDPQRDPSLYSFEDSQVPANQDAWPYGTKAVTVLGHTFNVRFTEVRAEGEEAEGEALAEPDSDVLEAEGGEAEGEGFAEPDPESDVDVVASWAHMGPYVTVEGTNVAFMFYNQLSQAAEVQEMLDGFAAADEVSFEDFEAFLNHHASAEDLQSAAQRAVELAEPGVPVSDAAGNAVSASLPNGLQAVTAYGTTFMVRFPEAPVPVEESVPVEEAETEVPVLVEVPVQEAPSELTLATQSLESRSAPATDSIGTMPFIADDAGTASFAAETADAADTAQSDLLAVALPAIAPPSTVQTVAATDPSVAQPAKSAAVPSVAASVRSGAPATVATPRSAAVSAASENAKSEAAEASAKPKPALPVTGVDKGSHAEASSMKDRTETAAMLEKPSSSTPKAAGAIALLGALGSGVGAFLLRRK